ncbi:MAG: hypothetical protein CM15mP86_05450 [Gammaproteobacteria bacterium]|nr:MAG: hypothetical protein CM15mP86_05450 [Gammaproteobacteria bacterium]
MGHMRDIEAALRGDVGDIEKGVPFWEFIDIEFDQKSKIFFYRFTNTPPMFPGIF